LVALMAPARLLEVNLENYQTWASVLEFPTVLL